MYSWLNLTEHYVLLVDNRPVKEAIPSRCCSALHYQHGKDEGQSRTKWEYWYCPDWSAPNKARRPKKNERRKSVLETALGNRVPKIPKRLTMFCQVCQAISHVTNDCWELDKNIKSCPATWWSQIEERVEEMNEEVGEAFAMSEGGKRKYWK